MMRTIPIREYARRHGLSVRTVSRWCRAGLIPDAKMEPITGSGNATWLIPETARPPKLKRGRPRKDGRT